MLVTGVHNVAAMLGRAPARSFPAIQGAVAATLHDIKTDAREDAPVLSGRYKRSIDYDVQGFKGEVGPRARYGHLVEDGGAHSAPNPVMKRATEANMDKFEDRLARAMVVGL